MSERQKRPKLLVSVASATEAVEALQGGADLIDLKRPDRGPLGRPDASDVLDLARILPDPHQRSLALGELADGPPDLHWVAHLGEARPRFVKFGTSRCRTSDDQTPSFSWRERARAWVESHDWQVILGIYADFDQPGVNGLEPTRAVEEAHALGCAGLLVDTFDKANPTRWYRQTAPPITPDWVAHARASGLLVALAGSLDAQAIPRLATWQPDFIAVRSAACLHGDRRGPIDPRRVEHLRLLLDQMSPDEAL